MVAKDHRSPVQAGRVSHATSPPGAEAPGDDAIHNYSINFGPQHPAPHGVLRLVPLRAALFVTPFVNGADAAATTASVICGIGLIALGLRRGPIAQCYGAWQRLIV